MGRTRHVRIIRRVALHRTPAGRSRCHGVFEHAGTGASPGQLVRRQLLDSLDVSGAATEATADLGVVGAIGSPFQDPALHRPQFLRFRRDARAGYPCVGDHSPDELWSAPEATSDLGFVDAVVNQADPTRCSRRWRGPAGSRLREGARNRCLRCPRRGRFRGCSYRPRCRPASAPTPPAPRGRR